MFGLREVFRCQRPNRQLMVTTHNRDPAVTKKRDGPQFWRSSGINHAGLQIDIAFAQGGAVLVGLCQELQRDTGGLLCHQSQKARPEGFGKAFAAA